MNGHEENMAFPAQASFTMTGKQDMVPSETSCPLTQSLKTDGEETLRKAHCEGLPSSCSVGSSVLTVVFALKMMADWKEGVQPGALLSPSFCTLSEDG